MTTTTTTTTLPVTYRPTTVMDMLADAGCPDAITSQLLDAVDCGSREADDDVLVVAIGCMEDGEGAAAGWDRVTVCACRGWFIAVAPAEQAPHDHDRRRQHVDAVLPTTARVAREADRLGLHQQHRVRQAVTDATDAAGRYLDTGDVRELAWMHRRAATAVRNLAAC